MEFKANNLQKDCKKSIKAGKLSETGFLISVWIFPVILFFVLYVYINFNSFMLAFKNILNDNFDYTWAGLDNFKKFINTVLKDPSLKYAFKNSVVIYLVNIIINTPIQIIVAFFIYKKIYGTSIFKIILFLPQIIAGVVWIMLFRYLCDYGVPSLAQKLGTTGIFLLDKDATIGFIMMLIYSSWIGIGGGMLIYVGTMSRIPDSVVEAGKLDGITMMQEFYYMIIPLVFPILSVSLVTSIHTIFTNQLFIYPFFKETAGPKLYTIGYYLFIQIIGSTTASVQKYSFAAAGGLIITAIVAPLTFAMRWFVNKIDPEVSY